MTRTATIVKPVGDDATAATIMDTESYESFPADIASDVEGLEEDDGVVYERDSSGEFGYTIIGRK